MSKNYPAGMLSRRRFLQGLLAFVAAKVMEQSGALVYSGTPNRTVFDMAANTWRQNMGPQYSLHDKFGAVETVGLVNGSSAIPGPGIRTVVDVDGGADPRLLGPLAPASSGFEIVVLTSEGPIALRRAEGEGIIEGTGLSSIIVPEGWRVSFDQGDLVVTAPYGMTEYAIQLAEKWLQRDESDVWVDEVGGSFG